LGRPRVLVRNALLGLVVSVIACATFIPRLGAVGAAAATAIAILTLNLLASAFLWRRMNFVPWDRPLVLSVAAFVAGTGTAILLSHFVANDLVQLAMSAALGGIPTLAVSVLAGGVADRKLIAATLHIAHRKGSPDDRGLSPGGSLDPARANRRSTLAAGPIGERRLAECHDQPMRYL
jgi:hypothetical protein